MHTIFIYKIHAKITHLKVLLQPWSSPANKMTTKLQSYLYKFKIKNLQVQRVQLKQK